MNRVQIVGSGDAEVKIYPIRRKAIKYRFFQIAWHELGERRTKTLSDPLNWTNSAAPPGSARESPRNLSGCKPS